MSKDYGIAKVNTEPVQVETKCLICGEGVTTYIGDLWPKICVRCRFAVMGMRKRFISCGNCVNWQYDSAHDIYCCSVSQDRVEIHDTPCKSWRLGE